jgi:hypothetical protein
MVVKEETQIYNGDIESSSSVVGVISPQEERRVVNKLDVRKPIFSGGAHADSSGRPTFSP